MLAQRPLARHALFRSTDLDEARERVAAVFCPHRLEAVGAQERFDAHHHHLPGERLTLNYIEYGARTLIAPGALEEFYLVQIPIEGGAEIVNGTDRYVSTPTLAAVLNPHRPTRMVWEEGTRQVLVQVRRDALQAHLDAELGAPSTRPLTFEGPLDLSVGVGAALRRFLLWLVAEADAGASPIGSGLMARQVEATVLSALLESDRHDHGSPLARVRSASGPRHVRMAEAFIEAHLDQPITLADVARATGISERGLQLASDSTAIRRRSPSGGMPAWPGRMRTSKSRRPARRSRRSPCAGVLPTSGRFSELHRERYGLCPRDALRAATGRAK
jgi:hypothetical protein